MMLLAVTLEDWISSTPWLRNSFQHPLTEEQESLLAHGLNFAVTLHRPPHREYITAIETVCQSLDSNTAEELRADVYRALRHPHQLKLNLSRDEIKAMKQLKVDEDHMVLTTDKGVALVVIDRSDYIRKAPELLDDISTYRTIQSDPTNKLKNKLINIQRRKKLIQACRKTSLEECTLQGPVLQNLWASKNTQEECPPEAIVSSIGSVSYGVANELAKIIKPLVGTSNHHVNNTKEFADEIKKTKL